MQQQATQQDEIDRKERERRLFALELDQQKREFAKQIQAKHTVRSFPLPAFLFLLPLLFRCA